MKRNTKIIFVILFSVFCLHLQAQTEPEWVKDAKFALGDDLKEKFRAKDRLKELDHLDELMLRELKGPHQKLVLDLIKELKLRGLLPQIKDLALEKEDRYLFHVMNSLTIKDDVKFYKGVYRDLEKKGKKFSIQGYIEFFDLYNLNINFSDLAEMFQNGDDEDKKKVSEYLVSKLDFYEISQVTFFVNTALNSAPTKVKIILLSGLRRLPDPEIKKYSIDFKRCEKDTDKTLADLCHRLWLYTEKK
jgi:hypothetical protein